MVDEKECFVICPLDKDDSLIRRRSNILKQLIIEPVIKKYGYVISRADILPTPGDITAQIIDRVIHADLVIADLTGHNSNVYYELAIRHVQDKPVIQMAFKGTKIPFDIAGMRTIFYDVNLSQGLAAMDELDKQVQSLVREQFESINPVKSFLSYLNLQSLISKGAETPTEELLQFFNTKIQQLSNQISNLDNSEKNQFKYSAQSNFSPEDLVHFSNQIKNHLVDIEARLDELYRDKHELEKLPKKSQSEDELWDWKKPLMREIHENHMLANINMDRLIEFVDSIKR